MCHKLLPSSCFGYSLQTGCMVAAIVQVIVAFPLLILAIKDLSYSNGLNIIIASGTFVVVQIVQLLFAGCLFNGSKERNLPICKLWAAITVILTAATCIFITYRIIAGQMEISSSTLSASPLIVLSIASLFTNMSCLWVGLSFIHNVLLEEGSEGGTVYNYD